tara:strand:+ start:430 stop:918 length:489 start_codon:yes stop_codon:yes gene_type:complete
MKANSVFNRNFAYLSILFLFLNFFGLYLGVFFTGEGVTSDWYQTLNKAPWTPPGWVFGFAWTSIMICFAFYLSKVFTKGPNRKINVIIYTSQWILNLSWNPLFFYFHEMAIAMVILILLLIVLLYLLYVNYSTLKTSSYLLLPYVLWLIVACSLNAYTLFNN